VWGLALVLLVALGLCVTTLAPPMKAGALLAVFCWMALPGVIVARRLYGATSSAWIGALLVGPVWGSAASSVALLALWLSGVRHPILLACAPLAIALVAVPARHLAPSLRLAEFDRRDVLPVLLVLTLVPLVVGRPFAKVGEMRPEGKAYRAYFIADFEWAMAVVSEVSKGDIPPRNPFLAGDTLHYYWLNDLLSAVEHRVAGPTLALESIILVNDILVDVCYVAFFYFFVRHFVRSSGAAAIGVIAAVLFTSFEGTWQLYDFWQRGLPLAAFRLLNIDAISNWVFGSLKIDGLHRVLLYQSQHATAWALSLSALIVLRQARDNGRPAVNLLAGLLLSVSLLVSSFIAVMVGCVLMLYQAVTLRLRRQWKALGVGACAAGVPVGVAVLIASLLQYVDRSGGQVVYVGILNPVAAHRALLGIFLSFGPMLIAACAGVGVAVWRRAYALAVLALAVAVSFLFYFFVDVVDHQHAYVGWRAGHLLFMTFAPLVAYGWQELTALGGWARRATIAVAAALALASSPMTIVDLYNTQDTANQAQGPGFKWTEIVSPDELEALAWIKASTPLDAQIQVDPVRASGTWAYMPAFGERRMTAGMPISMIPIKKYKDASERVRRVFAATDGAHAYAGASALALQYIYVGPRERQSYPRLEAVLDSAAYGFIPIFRNRSVMIYRVAAGHLVADSRHTTPSPSALP
jgi:hypothetical protein